jgi:hypothetical protein
LGVCVDDAFVSGGEVVDGAVGQDGGNLIAAVQPSRVMKITYELHGCGIEARREDGLPHS